jgi:hypothetical protein
MIGTEILPEEKTAVAHEGTRDRLFVRGEPDENDYGQQTHTFSSVTTESTAKIFRTSARSPLRAIPAFTEVILNWWIGEVQEIYDDYFVATMVDVDGEESIVEFDLTSVREEDQNRVEVGAAFTFAVTRQDRRDGRRLVSEIELLEPYRWTAQDEERALRLVHEHFPEISAFDHQ